MLAAASVLLAVADSAAPADQVLKTDSAMTEDALSHHIAEGARLRLASEVFTGALVRQKGVVGTPLAVTGPEGDLQSWLAPVLAGDLLAGFFRTDPDLADWRWISFQRRQDSLAGCPLAADWLNPAAIRRRAGTLARPGETAGTPVLSYDQIPDRLAWAVPLLATGSGSRTVFVTGPTAWPAHKGPIAGTGG
jgi:hypothetical protein